MFGLFGGRQKAPQMSAKEAVAGLKAGAVVVIDVREPSETASGAAKGALKIPMAALRMKADPKSPECLAELQEGKPIAVYCASGGRSSMAARTLQSMGHEQVSNIGGFRNWLDAGGPVGR